MYDTKLIETARHAAKTFDGGTPGPVVALGALAALRGSGADAPTSRSVFLATGDPRLVETAKRPGAWHTAWRDSLRSMDVVTPPGEVADAATRDRLSVSAARRTVGQLTAVSLRLEALRGGGGSRRGLATAMAGTAVIGLGETDIARTQGWRGVLLTGGRIATEIGLQSDGAASRLTKRLAELNIVKVGRRPKGGRGRVFSLRRYDRFVLLEDYGLAETIDALAVGAGGVDVLADLISSVTQPAWHYGPGAPGHPVWAGVLQLAGLPAHLPDSTIYRAKRWLRQHDLSPAGVADFIAAESLRPDVTAAKQEVIDRRVQQAADLREATAHRGKLIKAAGQVVRQVAVRATEKPGSRRHVASLAPKPEWGTPALKAWLESFAAELDDVADQLPDELAPFIARELVAGLTLGGWPEDVTKAAAAVVAQVLERGEEAEGEVVAELPDVPAPLPLPEPVLLATPLPY